MLVATGGCSGPQPTYVPRDPELKKLPLLFYPVASQGPARAMVFFFGNDVGFWKPHQELAAYLSGQGYTVVGFDIRSFLANLPEGHPQRDSAFSTRILPIIARARHEIGADSLPLLIFGHSLGAEIALWTAAYAKPPGVVGLVAMSPGLSSHLRVSASDLLMGAEPKGPDSFQVPAAVKAIDPGVRIAIVRGSQDKYRYADPALTAAGGDRIETFVVPFASHSLRNLILAKPIVRHAMDWILESPRSQTMIGGAEGH
jgi:pimeloyl-ACP methyl ester carboxylesterase